MDVSVPVDRAGGRPAGPFDGGRQGLVEFPMEPAQLWPPSVMLMPAATGSRCSTPSRTGSHWRNWAGHAARLGAMLRWLFSLVVIRSWDISSLGKSASIRDTDTGCSVAGGLRCSSFSSMSISIAPVVAGFLLWTGRRWRCRSFPLFPGWRRSRGYGRCRRPGPGGSRNMVASGDLSPASLACHWPSGARADMSVVWMEASP